MRALVITNIYPTPRAPANGTFVEQQVEGLRRSGVDVDVLFVDRLADGASVYRMIPAELARRRHASGPDLVHVMYGGVMAERVTRATGGLPTVVTFHGSDLLGENLSGPVRKAISRYGVWCSWLAARRATGVVVVSRLIERALPRGVDRGKVRVIPCGIDLQRFTPRDAGVCRRQLGWESDCFNVLFNGNSVDPVKRPEMAREAVRLLNERGVRTRLRELRGVPYSDVPTWFCAADALLLTSLHEGSPTVVKEALACDLAVVSVDVGDVRERIEAVDGCFLSGPSPAELAEKLAAVEQRGGRIEGRRTMEALSLERTAGDLRDFYAEILNQRSRPIRAGA